MFPPARHVVEPDNASPRVVVIGPNFQDMCRGQARPTEFRTAPLIGVRLLERFLHDGRAASVGEAIRLHGGQADLPKDHRNDGAVL